MSRTPTGSYAGSWALIVAVATACLLACYGLGFRFGGLAVPGVAVLLLAAGSIVGRSTGRPRLYAGASAFLLMTLFTILGVVLSYALAARGGMVWDGALARIDRQLGFDWPAVFDAADNAPASVWIGGVAYHSLPLQMIVCIVALSGTGRVKPLETAVAAAIMSGFATILISGLTPAMGNVFDPAGYRLLWPSVAWMERDMIAGLRDGSLRTLDLTHLWGIVTFPSYHAALPIILAWAQRDVPWLRVIAPIWAGLTILATPLFGGHYGVDVLAGIALAPAALAMASSGIWQHLATLCAQAYAARQRTARPISAFSDRGLPVSGTIDVLD
ncbi:phosphatase PAP2 family protein [uncultured Sphingomonas sp.]|uniref:phosphatase PAP2 family protein n=1 Tax=uncultured Sphingomonas sp. TaxID=158754 RepID=UPI0025D526C9|nr:phosphatase PAP2 family protein [uncultured Sphingomonas sp.]